MVSMFAVLLLLMHLFVLVFVHSVEQQHLLRLHLIEVVIGVGTITDRLDMMFKIPTLLL